MDTEKRKQYMKEYRQKNKERIKEKNKEWELNNKTERDTYRREYKKRPETKEKIKIWDRTWQLKNKDKLTKYNKEYYINNSELIKRAKLWYEENKDIACDYRKEYMKKRKKEDPLFRLRHNISKLISFTVRRAGFVKKSKSLDILGCSDYIEFKNHIESLWEPWMTWENYGLYNGELNYGWDIDHITPVSSAINEEGVIALNHYTNLQPLCSKVNRHIKRGNIV